MAAAMLLVILLTEVTSNTATTSMILPVLIGLAQASNMDPVPMTLAVTMVASFAFMLPVSTPPNAIAYGTGLLRLDTMLSKGFRLDAMAFVIVLVAGALLFPLVLP
jgi:sodium-dependent dicarboxylate transporter 2/3/5